jgi:hypothetical protein
VRNEYFTIELTTIALGRIVEVCIINS